MGLKWLPRVLTTKALNLEGSHVGGLTFGAMHAFREFGDVLGSSQLVPIKQSFKINWNKIFGNTLYIVSGQDYSNLIRRFQGHPKPPELSCLLENLAFHEHTFKYGKNRLSKT